MTAQVPVRTCPECGSYPCRCRRADDRVLERARYRKGPIEEPCACGLVIRAVTFLAPDIVEAVQRHQIEPVHIAYDLAHGIDLSGPQLRALGGR